MMPTNCGIWPAPRRLVAVIAGEDGRAGAPIAVARTDDARAALIHHLSDAGTTALVLPRPALDADPLIALAITEGLRVWLAPAGLVEPVRRAAALATPRLLAALLARLPAVPSLRAQLVRLEPAGQDPRQLALF
jgi:hypothetical protein